MNPGHTVTITPTEAHVQVHIAGELFAETRGALLLDETGLPPRYYLPRSDVRMDLLNPTSFETTCPFKGQASYWSTEVGGKAYDGVVWSYEHPLPNAAAVAGYLSFYPDRAEITVDGEALAA